MSVTIRIWPDASAIQPIEQRWSLGLSNDFRPGSGTFPVIQLPVGSDATIWGDPVPTGDFTFVPGHPAPVVAAVTAVVERGVADGLAAHLLVGNTFVRAASIQRKFGLIKLNVKRARDIVTFLADDGDNVCVECAPFFDVDVVDRAHWLAVTHGCVVLHDPALELSAGLVRQSVLREGRNTASFSRVLNADWFGDSALMYMVGTGVSNAASLVLRCAPSVLDCWSERLGGQNEASHSHKA